MFALALVMYICSILGLTRCSTPSVHKTEIILAWIIGALGFCLVMGQDNRQLGTWLRLVFPAAILCGHLSDMVVVLATSSEEVARLGSTREKVDS